MERGRSLERSMEVSFLRESKNIGVMPAIYITLPAGNKFRNCARAKEETLMVFFGKPHAGLQMCLAW
jgi:hypothetical protein